MSIRRLTCTLKTSIWSKEYRRTYRSLRNVNLVRWAYDDLEVPSKRQSGQGNIRRPTSHLKCQSSQMSIRRLTGTLKTTIWSKEYTMTNRSLRNVNLVRWAYDDLEVPSKRQSGQGNIRRPTSHLKCQSSQMSIRRLTCTLKTSIWSKEYRRTYRSLRNVNLVRWAYDDLEVPSKRQSGQGNIRRPTSHLKCQSSQMSIRRLTGTLKTTIWSKEYTMTNRSLRNVNLVKWAYDDLQVPSTRQSGQRSIRWPTGHLEMSI